MIVSHTDRFVFIHVQKTGGSSVTRALLQVLTEGCEVPGSKHGQLSAAYKMFPQARGYFAMGFVRNPWARMYSWHAMILRRNEEVMAGTYDAELFARNAFWQRIIHQYPDFETFVLDGTREVPRLATPQVNYLETAKRRADFIGRTENLHADLFSGLTRAGLAIPEVVPKSNAGPERDYRDRYTDAMRRRVAEVYARDIQEFGYSF